MRHKEKYDLLPDILKIFRIRPILRGEIDLANDTHENRAYMAKVRQQIRIFYAPGDYVYKIEKTNSRHAPGSTIPSRVRGSSHPAIDH